MFVKSTQIMNTNNGVGKTISNWLHDYIKDNKGLSPAVSRLLTYGVLIGFNGNDFINPSKFKGFIKLYKCNSEKPKYFKKYLGKDIGMVTMLGFKVVDYDHTLHYILASKMEFLSVLQSEMIEEFPEYPSELYLYDLMLEHPEWGIEFKYNRCWENIKGLTPQEKIVLANAHNEEAFPNSYYENDRGTFSRRTQDNERDIRFQSEISDVSHMDYDIRDYEKDNDIYTTFDIVDRIISEREKTFHQVNEGFDYKDFQEFSDIYTRTETCIEDYELYPVRVNCLPKAIKKRGKSPYDTKLGVRKYIYHNMWAKPVPLNAWKNRPEVVKMRREKKLARDARIRKEEEELMSKGSHISDDIWSEIEKAYEMR